MVCFKTFLVFVVSLSFFNLHIFLGDFSDCSLILKFSLK